MRVCKSEVEDATASRKDLEVSQFTHLSDEETDLLGHLGKGDMYLIDFV